MAGTPGESETGSQVSSRIRRAASLVTSAGIWSHSFGARVEQAYQVLSLPESGFYTFQIFNVSTISPSRSSYCLKYSMKCFISVMTARRSSRHHSKSVQASARSSLSVRQGLSGFTLLQLLSLSTVFFISHF